MTQLAFLLAFSKRRSNIKKSQSDFLCEVTRKANGLLTNQNGHLIFFLVPYAALLNSSTICSTVISKWEVV